MASRDYKHSNRQRYSRSGQGRRPTPAWFWMLLGFLPGMLLAILTYLDKHDPRHDRTADVRTHSEQLEARMSKSGDKSRTKLSGNRDKAKTGKPATDNTRTEETAGGIRFTFQKQLQKDNPRIRHTGGSQNRKTGTGTNQASKDKTKPVKTASRQSGTTKPTRKTGKTATARNRNRNRTKPASHKQNRGKQNKGYILQAGSFRKQTQAKARVLRLSKIGIKAKIRSVKIKGKTWYRVQAGPFRQDRVIKRNLERLKKYRIGAMAVRLR